MRKIVLRLSSRRLATIPLRCFYVYINFLDIDYLWFIRQMSTNDKKDDQLIGKRRPQRVFFPDEPYF
ncbi:MAG: hypothetical protein P8175_06390 [Deltaproteobacteria bacterium]